MIKQISIQNFQSHKQTELDLHKGVNVIIGSSDSGKSAIIRALNWLINNKPSGDSFRSNWGGDTSVDVTLENKDCISREKGKDNSYILSSSKGNSPQEYKAFGADVPEPIKNLLNFTEINFQYQLDSPFLLSRTAGEVAKYLNQIVNLESIDLALSKIEKRKRNINDQIKFTTQEIKKKEDSLKQYDHLNEMEELIESVEKKQKTFTDLKNQYTSLFNTIRQVKSIQQEIKEAKKNLPPEKEIEALISKAANLKELQDEYEDLQNNINRITILQKSIEKHKYNKKQLEATQHKLTPTTCPLCDQVIKNGRTGKN